jgi:hypothetical protein
MIKKLAVVTVSLLTACSTTPTTSPFFYSQTTVVQWRKVVNVNEYCRQAMPDKKLKANEVYQGCAFWSKVEPKCTIITGYKDDLAVIGHELKHCFNGAFH